MLLLPLGALAQVEYYQVLVNSTYEYDFESFPGSAVVLNAPNNGDYYFNGGLNSPNSGLSGSNTILYVPETDFLGLDTMKVSYWIDDPIIPSSSTLTLVFEVIPAFITANADYAITAPGVAVNIDVVANDDASGVISLVNIPVSNHGNATLGSNGTIDFNPTAGFTGTAQFNYTICDLDNNVCDVATVNVFVDDNTSSNDTTLLVTMKDMPIKALIPLDNGAQEVLAPANGTLAIISGGLEYTPADDYVGKDTFTYVYNLNASSPSVATFVIDVLWAEDPNNFVVDDYGYTSINNPISLNGLENDLNDQLSVISYTQSVNGGAVVHNGAGDFSYTPAAGFEGIDEFNYTAAITGTPNQEEATVYVVVSNQEPSTQTFGLTTPVNTPLVINYNIPITNFDFAITSAGINGTAEFYPGDFANYGLQVNGQNVSGYNLVIYYPEEDFSGLDEFEMNYCVGSDCQLVKIELEVVELELPQADTLCVNDCVWSGDANYDGKVDMNDLLPVGYCAGEVGFERPNSVVEWYGQYGENWLGTIGETPINVKHVDTDGDGYIEAEDTAALSQFYGLYHNITPADNLTSNNVPLFFVPQNPNPGPGDMVVIDIILGLPVLPATDFHGLTFSLNFNENIVESGTMNVNFDNENWMAYNSAMISMVKQPYIGRIEAGYTRTTGISANGYGKIGEVSFIIVDDAIDGFRLKDTLRQTFRVETPKVMDSGGRYLNIVTQDFDIRIARDIKEEESEKSLLVFPNPTTNELNVHLNGENELEQIVIMSITGQEIFRSDNVEGKQFQMALGKHYANGIYIVQARTSKGVINQKFEIIR